MPSCVARHDDITAALSGNLSELHALRAQRDWVRRTQIEQEAAKKIEASIAYQMRNLEKHFPISTLAEVAGVSVSSFFELFKRATGSSPACLFTHLRILRACALLEDTTLMVKEIADALGYEDSLYFSRVFKTATGLSPSTYRQTVAETKPPADWTPRIGPLSRKGEHRWSLDHVTPPETFLHTTTNLEGRYAQKSRTVSSNQ